VTALVLLLPVTALALLFVAWCLGRSLLQIAAVRDRATIVEFLRSLDIAAEVEAQSWDQPTAEVTRRAVPVAEIATHHRGVPARDILVRLAAERAEFDQMIRASFPVAAMAVAA
jgi:hypothetical protein